MAHSHRSHVLQIAAAREAAEYRARVKSGRVRHTSFVTILLASSALLSANTAHAQAVLPQGGRVVAGSAGITTSGNTTTVTQTSNRAVVNWNSFSVGAGETVQFVQPGAGAAILNRVTGNTTSTIAGQITGNGQVYLVNPNGIVITAAGTVDLGGGFVASTLDIADKDFMNGKLAFKGDGASALVSNAGSIRVGRGGFAALLGGAVSNSGTVTVPLGKIALNSGEAATLDFTGDGFMQVVLPGSGTAAAAAGGSAVMRTSTVVGAVRGAVHLPSELDASSAHMDGSALVLGGAEGTTTVSGKLDVSSTNGPNSGKGGAIAVGGTNIALTGATIDASGAAGGGTVNIGGGNRGATVAGLATASTVSIDAASTIKADATGAGTGGQVTVWSNDATSFAGQISAQALGAQGDGGNAEVSGHSLNYSGTTNLLTVHGKTGNLLLDPYNVTISTGADSSTSGFSATGSGATINTTTLQNALATANVTVSTGASGAETGNITVSNAVTWSSASTLTLNAAGSIAVNANLSGGTGSAIVLAADNAATGSGTVTFGAGVTATASGGVSAYYNPTTFGTANSYTAYQGTGTTITGYMLVNTAAQLQNISTNTAGNYALNANITESGNFTPIATFTGIFNGQYHTINNLTISQSGSSNVGLFATSSGTIKNVGIVGGSITGAGDVGSIIGTMSGGSLTNVWSTASVTGSSPENSPRVDGCSVNL